LDPSFARLAVDQPEQIGDAIRRWTRESARGVVIVVDQIEELFTLYTSPNLHHHFACAIASTCTDEQARVRVVLSLREDFFGRLATLAPLHGLYARQVEVVQPLDRDGLRSALLRPIQLFGFTLEDLALADAIVDPLVDKPAGPAILQF